MAEYFEVWNGKIQMFECSGNFGSFAKILTSNPQLVFLFLVVGRSSSSSSAAAAAASSQSQLLDLGSTGFRLVDRSVVSTDVR